MHTLWSAVPLRVNYKKNWQGKSLQGKNQLLSYMVLTYCLIPKAFLPFLTALTCYHKKNICVNTACQKSVSTLFPSYLFITIPYWDMVSQYLMDLMVHLFWWYFPQWKFPLSVQSVTLESYKCDICEPHFASQKSHSCCFLTRYIITRIRVVCSWKETWHK